MNRTPEEWKDFIHTQGYVEVLGSVVEWAKAVDDLSTLSSEVKRVEEEIADRDARLADMTKMLTLTTQRLKAAEEDARVYREAWETREAWLEITAHHDISESENEMRAMEEADEAVRRLRESRALAATPAPKPEEAPGVVESFAGLRKLIGDDFKDVDPERYVADLRHGQDEALRFYMEAAFEAGQRLGKWQVQYTGPNKVPIEPPMGMDEFIDVYLAAHKEAAHG